MTSDTLRKIMIVGAAFAAVSVGACKKPAENTAENTAAASDANAAMASSNAPAASNTAAAAANTASNDASATAPASTNSMSK